MLMQATLIKPGWSKKQNKTKQHENRRRSEWKKGLNRRGMRGGNMNLK